MAHQNNWQFMYEEHAELLRKKSEKLDDIPGLLTINKVKPREFKKKSTRVTNVHGSMKGQDILARSGQS